MAGGLVANSTLVPSIAIVLVCELARACVLVPLGLNATVIREGFTKKSCSSFRFCPNYLLPSPQFGQLVQLFSDVEIQDLKVSLRLQILYTI